MFTKEQKDRTNLGVIRDLGEAFNRCDLDAIMELFADDAVYQNFEGPAPAGACYAGKAAIREIFQRQIDALPDRHFADYIAIADGDAGALEYTLVVPGDPERRIKLCDFFEFKSGKVVRKSTWMKAVQWT
jgi:ketosteroid isomerase-like protein